MSFAHFMSSPTGRGIRIVAGIAIIAAGLSLGSVGGYILAAVGLVPLFAGVANVCIIAPIIGAPFSGQSTSSSQ